MHYCLESDSKEELIREIKGFERNGWELIREWEDKGNYCALVELK